MADPETPYTAPSPDPANEEKEAPGFLSQYGALLVRDVAVGLVALSLFAATDAWRIVTGSGFAGGLSLFMGLVAGFAVTILVHEWGHLVGGRWSGAKMTPKPLTSPPQVFDFDYAGNDPSQFRAMSIGGNLAHFAVVVLFMIALPLETPGQVALFAGAMGSAVFASSIEFPVISKSSQGATNLEALGEISPNFLKKNGSYGALAALLVLIVL